MKRQEAARFRIDLESPLLNHQRQLAVFELTLDGVTWARSTIAEPFGSKCAPRCEADVTPSGLSGLPKMVI